MEKRILIVFLLMFNALWAQNIDEIQISGNEKTKTSLIKKLLTTQLGDDYKNASVQEDIEFLKRLPAVKNAHSKLKNEQGKNVLVFEIEERFTIIPIIEIWADKDRNWFKVGAAEYNAFGQNVTLEAHYLYNNKHSYGIQAKAPFLFNNKWGMGFSHRYFNSIEPLYFQNPLDKEGSDTREFTADYNYQNISAEVLGLYQMNFANKLEFGINAFNEKYSYLRGADSVKAPPGLDILKILGKLYYQHYKVKHHYFYLDGYALDFSYQIVTSRKDKTPFQIGELFLKYFKRTANKGNLGVQMKLGLSSNHSTPFSAFVIDNHKNVRGVGNRINRGSGALVLNTEYRHTLLDKNWLAIQGVAFVDAATLRQAGGDLGNLFKETNLYASSGIGARFHLKNIFGATLRIDYAFGLNDRSGNGFVLGLGQYF
ncbi:MAG: outer membrane protein assembly factor [Flavobacteriales bacterium]|nr:outer membrane protein assembly factor [Flavobacteriales bacterium]